MKNDNITISREKFREYFAEFMDAHLTKFSNTISTRYYATEIEYRNLLDKADQAQKDITRLVDEKKRFEHLKDQQMKWHIILLYVLSMSALWFAFFIGQGFEGITQWTPDGRHFFATLWGLSTIGTMIYFMKTQFKKLCW